MELQETETMADRVPQNYGNHTRFDPLYHFFALPVVMLSVIVTLVHCLHRRNPFSIWLVVFSISIVVVTLKVRLYATKLQDRIIRLEERLRRYGLLPETLRARIGELTEAQLVGLRFASDGEIPGLVEEALSKKLPVSEIKKSIKVWRPDYFRV
jgi:hypothetical protein